VLVGFRPGTGSQRNRQGAAQGGQQARVDIAPVMAGTPSPDNQLTPGDLVVVEQILLGQASYP